MSILLQYQTAVTIAQDLIGRDDDGGRDPAKIRQPIMHGAFGKQIMDHGKAIGIIPLKINKNSGLQQNPV